MHPTADTIILLYIHSLGAAGDAEPLAGLLISMWQIRNPEIKPATLNFSSSGQGKLQVSQLFSDGIENNGGASFLTSKMGTLPFRIGSGFPEVRVLTRASSDSPVSAFFGKLRGRAAEAQALDASHNFMELVESVADALRIIDS